MPLETRAIDFVGYDSRGQVVLLAEAKSRSGTSDKWASQLRRNILAHGALPQAPFFLIATPDRIYLWKEQGLSAAEAPPDLILNAGDALAPYLERLRPSVSQLSPEAFEFVVLSWLSDLARSPSTEAPQNSTLRWLSESGFLDSIRNAQIEHQAA